MIGRGLQLRELFIGLHISVNDALILFGYLVPFFMLLVLPLSCMLSVFLTFLRMSTDREMIALKTGGINLYQLLPAPLAFCVLCALVSVYISLYGLSWGMEHFRATIMEIANTRAKIVVQPGVFNQDIFGLTLFARKVDASTGAMQQIIFEDRTRDKKNRLTILAPHGEITTDSEQGSLIFRLRGGQIYRVDGEQLGTVSFQEYAIRLNLSEIFASIDLGDVRPKEMSWETLTRLRSGRNGSKDRFMLKVDVELHKRWALPLACVVLGLFAIPLACAFEGVRRQMGAILSLLLFLLYYTLLSLGVSTGEAGKLPPLIGLWLPNLLFAGAGIFGLHMTVHERAPSFASLLQRFPGFRKQVSEDATKGRDI